MSKTDDGDASSPGLPGELVRAVAERLKEENSDLHEYGYQLALVPEAPGDGEALALAPVGGADGNGRAGVDEGGDEDGGHGAASDGADARREDPGPSGHWSEVEVQKLPNHELRIRLRGYTEDGATDHERRMAELVRELVKQAIM